MPAVLSLEFPADPIRRSEWIVAQRPQRNRVDPNQPYAFLVEDECAANGEVVPVATIFLTNRECPWRCTMCDLWKNTLTESVRPGTIPRQIKYALDRLPTARQIKLYNSGSFFDEQAISRAEDDAIAPQVANFERVIVECHPALIGDRCFRFRRQLSGQLEVAIGLETAHPDVLQKLNKRMTVDQFTRSAKTLRAHEIDVRVFLLVHPPFMKLDESTEWVQRSIDLAFACGATAVSLIPTRTGNGAMEALYRAGDFVPATLAALEDAGSYGLNLHRGRVFTDLWDLRQAAPKCAYCWPARMQRLQAMNLSQTTLQRIGCDQCGGRS